MTDTLITIAVDLAAIAILGFSAIIGRKRGLIKTLSGIVALVLSFSLAGYVSKIATPIISEKYVSPYISDTINSKLISSAENETSAHLPEALEEIGIPEDIIIDSLAENLADPIAHVADVVAKKITYAVLFLASFLILLLLISLLLKLLNLAAKFPGINFVNKFAGLLVGLLWGYLLVVSASYLLSQFRIILTPELIDNTMVLKHIINFSLVSLFKSI